MKLFRILIAIVVLAVVFVLSLRAPRNVHRFWGGVPSVVSYDGKRLSDSEVSLGTVDSAFDLLLLDARQHDGSLYVVNLTSRQVNELRTFDYHNASSAPFTSALAPIAATDVVVEPWRVEFTTPKGTRIRIPWMANL